MLQYLVRLLHRRIARRFAAYLPSEEKACIEIRPRGAYTVWWTYTPRYFGCDTALALITPGTTQVYSEWLSTARRPQQGQHRRALRASSLSEGIGKLRGHMIGSKRTGMLP